MLRSRLLLQSKALAWKNIILMMRMRWTTSCELLAPLLLMLVMSAMDVSTRATPPSTRPVPFSELSGQMLPCLVFDHETGIYGYGLPIPGAWCIPLLFAPTTSPAVLKIMTSVAARNGYTPPFELIGSQTKQGVPTARRIDGVKENFEHGASMIGFRTVGDLKQWVAMNPGRAGVGVIFGDSTLVEQRDGEIREVHTITSELPDTLNYELWYNESALRWKWYAKAGHDSLAAHVMGYRSALGGSLAFSDSGYLLSAQRMLDEAIIQWRRTQQLRPQQQGEASLLLELVEFPRVSDDQVP